MLEGSRKAAALMAQILMPMGTQLQHLSVCDAGQLNRVEVAKVGWHSIIANCLVLLNSSVSTL